MRIQRVVETVTVVLAVVSLLSLAAYFLALHDIARDYASPTLLRAQGLVGWERLPEWTACPLEWNVLTAGFLPMLLFHVVFLGSSVWRWRSGNRPHPEGSAP